MIPRPTLVCHYDLPSRIKDYYVFVVASGACARAMVTSAGGQYLGAECDRRVSS